VLAGFFIFITILAATNASLFELGIRTDNLKAAVPVYAGTTAVMFFVLVVASKMLRTKNKFSWWKDPHFLFLFIPISIAQQFIFQAFLFQYLLLLLPFGFAAILVGLVFGLLHTIFPRATFNFVITSIAGTVFAILFYIYPNLILASLSHMILNFTAVYLCFFTLLEANKTPKRTSLR